VIGAGHDVKTAELWSWEYRDGAYHAAAYGQGAGHLTESNAAQLWSTVYLAVQPPHWVPERKKRSEPFSR
jgi:hypothetical protein